ncbi:hypothetical protein SLNWT_4336 [Streptomyces albus]|uniref:Uncharacterized protein n=1 Tax=Streptomyces albus (strain ATCC 21838 / DSM 41398 / FERM P-419 / JCM 4703 / NBRC 107858) TaxID=1081613 RepID=A0A0B5F302_STRA4|nr:hypothetical protein SLNWT_4336 [Streptomyces albus]AOU79019.1 hypothetical protein SLNHY_4328 [Streptomyces albus]AYN34756.1 hypothetical protein DUI70_4257 [Streptomyces albus]
MEYEDLVQLWVAPCWIAMSAPVRPVGDVVSPRRVGSNGVTGQLLCVMA